MTWKYRRIPFIRTPPETFTQFGHAGGSDRRKTVAGRPIIGRYYNILKKYAFPVTVTQFPVKIQQKNVN